MPLGIFESGTLSLRHVIFDRLHAFKFEAEYKYRSLSKLVQAQASLMFAPFYTLYAFIVAIAIVVWIVVRRRQ
jgi:hypothetical protein